MNRFTRALLALATGTAAVAAGTVVAAPVAGAAVIDPDAYYQLISRHSGKAVDIEGAATTDAARVVQWTPGGGQHQQFRFLASGDGYYRIMARHSGKVLDVYGWNPDNGAQIVQWPDLNGANQQWRVVDADSGYVTLVNRFSGKALDVWEWSTVDGGRISQYQSTGGANQQWRLVRVDGDGGDPGGDPVDPAPVTGNIAAHDPSMISTPSGYVVFSTHNGVETRTSPDRVRFTRSAAAIPGGAPWATGYNGGDPNAIWAPDVSHHDDTYWLYYSVSTFGSNRSAIGLATSPTGQPGSFTDRGLVYESGPGDDYNAIDPSLLVDAQGGWWLVFGSFWSGIKMIRIDPATGKQSTLDQTRYSLASRPDTQIEGPTIVHRGGYYYLFVSVGLCCRGVDSTYRIMVGRATSPTGPYLDRSGVDMRAGGGTELLASHGRVIGPGGASVMADAGGDVLVYHYYDGAANGAVRLGLNRLSWEGDWPSLS
jgi:arabinan endo-1,5-alpha-L-arabinosidase